MKPSRKCVRLYGNPKCHKGIKEGRIIPPCRPIISGSGSNTEKISKFVDFYALGEMKKIKSYVQDTPDMLRHFDDENKTEVASPKVSL